MKDFDVYDLKDFVVENKDYYKTLDRNQMLEELNRKKYDFVWLVNAVDLMSFFAEGDADITRYEKLEQGCESDHSKLKTVCKLMLKIVENPRLPLDLSNPKHVAMVDTLVEHGILEVYEKEELKSLSTIKVSEVERLSRPGTEINSGHSNWLVGELRRV